MSITGVVYLQSDWPLPPPDDLAREQAADRRATRLLRSVDGLFHKLSEPWPARAALPTPFSNAEVQRLKRTRAATQADYFNEGVPLDQLKTNGVYLPSED